MAVVTQQKKADPQTHVLSVSFMKVGKLHQFGFAEFPELEIGDYVIADTRYLGRQMGQIKGFTPLEDLPQGEAIQNMHRPATPADLLTKQQWDEKALPALIECREKAAQSGDYSAAKFVNAEFNYDGTVLAIFYTCEDGVRINTHRLRGILLRSYANTRIEFRQVGPRDVAKMQGGFGACGIPRCCSTFLTEFSMVSINMAKAQGISLNPSEITGMCGRLRCCLMYEYEQYVEARKSLPAIRKRVGTPHGEGRVIELHPLQDAVTVRVDEENHLVHRDELQPLDEYEALKQAAASPCSKNEGGGCDCGAKRPRPAADDLLSEMGVPLEIISPTAASPEPSDPTISDATPPANPEKSSRRGRGRRRTGANPRAGSPRSGANPNGEPRDKTRPNSKRNRGKNKDDKQDG